uniref:DUF5615 domain-containing protein n=1 Tax=Cyanothece sp. (strain PCC 7425 / ATCC 29141) TaxID=395961 RepID=B8HTZ3_CYAP4
MSQIRLYLDEDATHNRLLQALRNRGADVISTVEAGRLSRSDTDQLEWALNNRRVIYSFNVRDFYQLHTEWLGQSRTHAGIILSKQDYGIGDQVRGLLQLITSKPAEEMENQVEFLGEWIRW